MATFCRHIAPWLLLSYTLADFSKENDCSEPPYEASFLQHKLDVQSHLLAGDVLSAARTHGVSRSSTRVTPATSWACSSSFQSSLSTWQVLKVVTSAATETPFFCSADFAYDLNYWVSNGAALLQESSQRTEKRKLDLSPADIEVVPFPSGSFEGCDTSTFAYGAIPGWSQTGTTACVASGNPVFQAVAIASPYLVALELTGTSISQAVTGLSPGTVYLLSAFMASQIGFEQASVSVTVGDQHVVQEALEFGALRLVSGSFVATNESMTITIKNSSPLGQHTVLVSDVSVTYDASQNCPTMLTSIDNLASLTACVPGPGGTGWCDYAPAGSGVVCIQSGDNRWGDATAHSGFSLVGLQGSGARISVTLSALTPGLAYRLSLWMGSSKGGGPTSVMVLLDSARVFSAPVPVGPLSLHTFTFTASSSTVSLALVNSGKDPARTVLVNDLLVEEEVPIAYGDFSGCSTTTSEIEDIPGWQSTGVTVCIAPGNKLWGAPLPLNLSGSAVGLEFNEASISQTITGLKVGESYSVSVRLGSRPGYPLAEGAVSVDSKVYIYKHVSPLPFSSYGFSFVALGTSANLAITNLAPGDTALLVSDVVVFYNPSQACTPMPSALLSSVPSLTDCAATPGGEYTTIQGWCSYPFAGGSQGFGTVCINSGEPNFGGVQSHFGPNLVGLDGAGASLSQTLSGLKKGKAYILSLWLASRIGHGEASVTVSVGGEVLFSQPLKTGELQLFYLPFNATEESATIIIVNSSPPGDQTVLVNYVQVQEQVEVVNGDFGACDTDTYAEGPLDGWLSEGDTACIAAGNDYYGKQVAMGSSYIAGLVVNGAGISQQLNLVPVSSYTLLVWLGSHAPEGSHGAAVVEVRIDGSVLARIELPAGPLAPFSFPFVALSANTTISFTNVSPDSLLAVLLAAVSVSYDPSQVCARDSWPPWYTAAGGMTTCPASNSEAEASGMCSYPAPGTAPGVGAVCFRAGDPRFGDIRPHSGDHLWALRGTGAFISQNVTGLQSGSTYELSLWLASATPGDEATVAIYVDGSLLLKQEIPAGPLTLFELVFVATSPSEKKSKWMSNVTSTEVQHTILILNVGRGAQTAYVNDFSLQQQFVSIQDFDFNGCSAVNPQYPWVPGWTTMGNALCIQAGDPKFGAPAAEGSDWLVGLVGRGSSISQSVPGTAPADAYTVTLWLGSRNQVTDVEVRVDGILYISARLVEKMVETSFTFIAQSSQATIEIVNSSPHDHPSLVFISSISISYDPSQVCAEAKTSPSLESLNGLDNCTNSPLEAVFQSVPGWCSYPAAGGSPDFGTVCIPSGVSPLWKNIQAHTGYYLWGLHGVGASVKQNVTGFTNQSSYTLSVWLSSESGDASAMIFVGKEVFHVGTVRPGPLREYTFKFTANYTTLNISVVNSSPHAEATIFVNGLTVGLSTTTTTTRALPVSSTSTTNTTTKSYSWTTSTTTTTTTTVAAYDMYTGAMGLLQASSETLFAAAQLAYQGTETRALDLIFVAQTLSLVGAREVKACLNGSTPVATGTETETTTNTNFARDSAEDLYVAATSMVASDPSTLQIAASQYSSGVKQVQVLLYAAAALGEVTDAQVQCAS